jgi:hypothetical protein
MTIKVKLLLFDRLLSITTHYFFSLVDISHHLMFIGNSLFNKEMFTDRFASLGYPTYIIYPLAFAKILGLVAIWSKKLKE